VTVPVPNGSLQDNKWTVKDDAGFSPAGDRRYILTCWPAAPFRNSAVLRHHAADDDEALHGLPRSVIKARRMTRQ